MTRFVVRIVSVGITVLGAGVACGQDYPNKPIHIVTGGAGGGSDVVSRQIAQGISGPLGQPVIVDNRVAILARNTVLKAPPDGYTLLVQGSILWVAPLLEKAPAYDAVNDFSPVALISREVFVLAVHPSLPVKSVKELLALAKARPGELNYAITSFGGPPHIAAELFKSMAGVNIVNVPYKSTPLAITAMISGEVQVSTFDAGLVAPHLKLGRLRGLAVTSAEPSALIPGLPTMAASGLPGFESVTWTGILAPAKTPATIINRLNQEIVRVLNQSDVKERFLNAGSEIFASSPEQFAATIKSETAKVGKIIKDAGIRPK